MNRQLFEYSYSLKKEKKRQGFMIVLYLILVISITSLLLHYVLFPVRQYSNSMVPDIKEQSLVMVFPFLKNKIDRGDVILIKSKDTHNYKFFRKALKSSVAFLTGQQIQLDEDKNYPGTKQQLRRVIAVPGDSIYMRDYVLYIKPEGERHYLTEFEIVKNNYNVTFYTAPSDWDSTIGVKGSFDEIILGEDEYFVLGDNRKNSSDSRLWGPLKETNICGKALFCYFPFDGIKIY